MSTWDKPVSIWNDILQARPHVWIPLLLVGALMASRLRKQRKPITGEQANELLVAGFGLYGAALIIKEAALRSGGDAGSWAMMIGGIAVGYYGIQQLMKVLTAVWAKETTAEQGAPEAAAGAPPPPALNAALPTPIAADGSTPAVEATGATASAAPDAEAGPPGTS